MLFERRIDMSCRYGIHLIVYDLAIKLNYLMQICLYHFPPVTKTFIIILSFGISYMEPRMLPIWNKLYITHDHCRVIISYHSAKSYMICSTNVRLLYSLFGWCGTGSLCIAMACLDMTLYILVIYKPARSLQFPSRSNNFCLDAENGYKSWFRCHTEHVF